MGDAENLCEEPGSVGGMTTDHVDDDAPYSNTTLLRSGSVGKGDDNPGTGYPPSSSVVLQEGWTCPSFRGETCSHGLCATTPCDICCSEVCAAGCEECVSQAVAGSLGTLLCPLFIVGLILTFCGVMMMTVLYGTEFDDDAYNVFSSPPEIM